VLPVQPLLPRRVQHLHAVAARAHAATCHGGVSREPCVRVVRVLVACCAGGSPRGCVRVACSARFPRFLLVRALSSPKLLSPFVSTSCCSLPARSCTAMTRCTMGISLRGRGGRSAHAHAGAPFRDNVSSCHARKQRSAPSSDVEHHDLPHRHARAAHVQKQDVACAPRRARRRRRRLSVRGVTGKVGGFRCATGARAGALEPAAAAARRAHRGRTTAPSTRSAPPPPARHVRGGGGNAVTSRAQPGALSQHGSCRTAHAPATRCPSPP
jgi:hypothetical protein